MAVTLTENNENFQRLEKSAFDTNMTQKMCLLWNHLPACVLGADSVGLSKSSLKAWAAEGDFSVPLIN